MVAEAKATLASVAQSRALGQRVLALALRRPSSPSRAKASRAFDAVVDIADVAVLALSAEVALHAAAEASRAREGQDAGRMAAPSADGADSRAHGFDALAVVGLAALARVVPRGGFVATPWRS